MALKTTNKNRNKVTFTEAKVELHEHNVHETVKKCSVKSYHKVFFFSLAVIAVVAFFIL